MKDGHENRKRTDPVADDRGDTREGRPPRSDAPSNDQRSNVHGYLLGLCYRLEQKEVSSHGAGKVDRDGAGRGESNLGRDG